METFFCLFVTIMLKKHYLKFKILKIWNQKKIRNVIKNQNNFISKSRTCNLIFLKYWEYWIKKTWNIKLILLNKLIYLIIILIITIDNCVPSYSLKDSNKHNKEINQKYPISKHIFILHTKWCKCLFHFCYKNTVKPLLEIL